jgi:hypothetical protein
MMECLFTNLGFLVALEDVARIAPMAPCEEWAFGFRRLDTSVREPAY